jgi:ABC-type nitrate/sulfonate/bicarbonate transport system permease component
MPPMFTGLRIDATIAVVGVVVGELVGGNVGRVICLRSAKARPTRRWSSFPS